MGRMTMLDEEKTRLT
jgi:hypothetical protein